MHFLMDIHYLDYFTFINRNANLDMWQSQNNAATKVSSIGSKNQLKSPKLKINFHQSLCLERLNAEEAEYADPL